MTEQAICPCFLRVWTHSGDMSDVGKYPKNVSTNLPLLDTSRKRVQVLIHRQERTR